MKRCHIFSDVSNKGNDYVGVYIAGNEPPKIIRFIDENRQRSSFYEIKTMFKALDYAVTRFTKTKIFIVHTDIIDIENLLKKNWFNDLFGIYLDRDDIEFHWEETRYYTKYKKCHYLARLAVGIYDDFSILSEPLLFSGDL
jgi:hypothetical protein